MESIKENKLMKEGVRQKSPFNSLQSELTKNFKDRIAAKSPKITYTKAMPNAVI